MNTTIVSLAFIGGLAVAIPAQAADNDITDKMPKVVNGKLVDPVAPPPPPKSYPSFVGQGEKARLELTPNVSLGGSATTDRSGNTTYSGNVRVPLPERK